MVIKNFGFLPMLIAAALVFDNPAQAAAPKPLKIALYEGPGTGGNGPPDLLRQFNNAAAGSSISNISPAQIRAGALSNFDVAIFAGGSGSKQAAALEESGRAAVQKFVGDGGGYIGICGGAYLATSGYPWSLHLINAKTLSSKWRRGKSMLKMELTQPGAEVLGGAMTNLTVLYHNGPVVGAAHAENLPPYETLAYFREEVSSNDTPKGIMINSPAIIRGQFKRGKVICISPHPEQTAGLEYLVTGAVKWVAPGKAASIAQQ